MKKLMSLLLAGVAIIAMSGCSDNVGEPDGVDELEPINTSCMPLGINDTWGDMAFDRNGDLLIAGSYAGELLLLDRETCEVSTYATIDGENVISVVDDSSRDSIYVGTDSGVYEINPNDGTYSKIVDLPNISSIVIAPEGYGSYGGHLVFAAYAKIYAYDPSEIDPPVLIVDNGSVIADLVFGEDGTLYAADYSGHKVITVASNGTIADFVTLPANIDGLEVDNAGSLFVASSGTSKLYSVNISTKTISELADVSFGGGWYPAGLAFDGFSTLLMRTNLGVETFDLD